MMALALAALVPAALGFNCTKQGCFFSYTNRVQGGITPRPAKNGGRCGEVDAAPRMPKDIWADPGAVTKYCEATINLYGSNTLGGGGDILEFGQCDHDPLLWFQNGSGPIKWDMGDFAKVCSACSTGEPDDPGRHHYCTLCWSPTYNAKDTVNFWYPRSNKQNIVQVAESVPTLSTLVTAVKAGNLVNTLSAPGELTVFAPNDDAFNRIPKLVLAGLLNPANVKELDKILELHIVVGKVLASDLTNGQKIKTVAGGVLTVSITTAGIFIGSDGTPASRVITPNVLAKNGVVHIVDHVLLPSLLPGKTIPQIAEGNPQLSTLVTALQAGGLVDTLSGAGPFTVFAPTNAAFDKLPAGVLSNLLKPENKAQLDDLLTYHVVSGAVFAKDLKDGEMVKTIEGNSLEVRLAGNIILIDSAEVITADVKASNGVVHIIDGVLIPPATPTPPPPPTPLPAPNKTIVDIATSDPDFSILVTALEAAGLVDTLNGVGPFSVFAPTNEAFDKLPAGVLASLLLPENKAQLVDLLTYHVVPANVEFEANMRTMKLPTLYVEEPGAPIGFLTTSWQVKSGDRRYFFFLGYGKGDQESYRFPQGRPEVVKASNGAVYPIGVVLIPPKRPGTIVDIATSVPDLSTLCVALSAAGLVDTLNGTTPFTVFAPTNEAFAALPAGTLATLLLPENKAKLVDILTYHVVKGIYQAKDLTNGEMLTTVEGKNVTVTITPNPNPGRSAEVLINAVQVTAADNEASNGVVHIINGVLLPPV